MKTLHCLCIALVLLLSWGCEKHNRIRRELSGTWEIEKSEISTYVDGEVTNTTTLEDLGTLELTDNKDVAPEYNYCLLDFAQGYWPLGFNELNITQAQQQGYCYWYGDLRARDRVTFWAPGGFAAADEIFVIYTRIKNANGLGDREQWMYIDVDANGAIATKEVLYLKLIDGSGEIQ
jgi:hypothetical protein